MPLLADLAPTRKAIARDLGDEFVTVELVDDPDGDGVIDPGGHNHLVNLLQLNA